MRANVYSHGCIAEGSNVHSVTTRTLSKQTLEPGTLRAEALDEEGNVLPQPANAHNELRTAGTPYRIRLTADRRLIHADGQDLSFITAEIADKDGIICPDATHRLTFKVEGKGILAAAGNADIKELDTTSDGQHKEMIYSVYPTN